MGVRHSTRPHSTPHARVMTHDSRFTIHDSTNEGLHLHLHRAGVDRDRSLAVASRARAHRPPWSRSERRGDRLRVVTMYTGAGAVDYGCERTNDANE